MFALVLFTLLTNFGWGNAGSTAFPLLRVPLGARPCALGEAFTGAADDINAIYFNPAGLGYLADIQLALAHQEWFADIRDENLSFMAPLGSGTLGISGVLSTMRNVENWYAGASYPETIALSSGYATVAYGVKLGDAIAFGIGAKGLYDALPDDNVGRGVCFDLGFLYRIRSGFRVGIAIQNLGPGIKYGSERFALPLGVRTGVSYRVNRERSWLNGLRVLFDANAARGGFPDFHFGMEYPLYEILFCRIGYRLGPQDYRSLSPWAGFTAGVGVARERWALDYAYVPYGELGATHRLTIRTGFAQPGYGRIRIRVTEVGTGLPIAHAHFTMEGTHFGQSYTESNGIFVVDGVQTGWVKIKVNADSFFSQSESLFVEPRETHTVNFVLRRAGYGSLWGGVYSERSRWPLAAKVHYCGPDSGTVQTNNIEGSFVIRKLAAGFYRLTITPDDISYLATVDSLTVVPGALVSRTFLLKERAAAGATDTLDNDEVKQDNQQQ
ncbi:PorV/PorQ family protein [candidate division WOR-3 bacterium]|nr:PorV/PorQ family protein [candidate division WOR-3 bacterium]